MEHLRAYELYCHNHIDRPQLIGILPERRRNLQRITHESIMNWAKNILGSDWNMEKINFIEVTINKMTGELIESNQILHPLQKRKKVDPPSCS